VTKESASELKTCQTAKVGLADLLYIPFGDFSLLAIGAFYVATIRK